MGRLSALLAGLVLAAATVAIPAAHAAAPDEPDIPFEKYTLANGLDVVLAPDHSVPYVWVHVRYEVGSKDETPGRSGFAHLFEHMMFQGSLHADDDYFQPLQKIGGQVNGNTTLDRTVYFEGVPSEYLPLALFLESDRMGWLPDAVTDEKLANQKDVVRNERRQRYEVPPYGELWPTILESVYPEGHPYHIATIGKHADLEAATVPDTLEFFRRWYLPNNATLVLTGDFATDEAKALVETYFGDVPAGAEPPVTTAPEVKLTGTKEVVVQKAVPFTAVSMVWISPAVLAPGDAELDLVASVLSEGEDSPLYKSLVRDRQIAQSVNAFQRSARLGSMFTIQAFASGEHTAEELVAAIDEVLATARAKGVSQEDLDLARTGYEVGYFGRLRTIQGKAGQLADYNGMTGDPGYLSKDLARYRNATPESVTAALRQYLPAEDRVIVIFEKPEAK